MLSKRLADIARTMSKNQLGVSPGGVSFMRGQLGFNGNAQSAAKRATETKTAASNNYQAAMYRAKGVKKPMWLLEQQ